VLAHGRPPLDAALTIRLLRRRVPSPHRELHADHGSQSSAMMQFTAVRTYKTTTPHDCF